ncbi:pyruvate formate-lyase-activating protein [Velocimicrobium porci]|nr:pyruvate formate-lyase-activating protein [Velocimicrobium porci]
MEGRIHSLESCGTVDGPGIRFVTFLQGCPLRCQYCHNADTWDTKGGTVYTPEALVKEIKKYKSYMKFSGGGVTFTGGEPLLQAEFLREVCTLCKKEEISTAIDTSGFIFNQTVKELLEVTDLVLLDMKNFDPEVYKTVTGVPLKPTLQFLDYLKEKGIKTWIRYVLVPGLTDNLDTIKSMAKYLKGYENVERIELLPFHKMGEFKWKELGYNYQLADTEPPSKELINRVIELLKLSGKEIE